MAAQASALEDKRVVVVGGSSGLGFAVAELAQSLGAEVVIASKTQDSVNAAAAKLPGVVGETVDLKDEAAIAGLLERLQSFDHLVITGGDYDKRVFVATDELDLRFAREALEARVFGSMAFIKLGYGRAAEGGSITLTSGMLAQRPRKGSPLPTVVAGAVEQVVKGFAMDLAPLRINAVCPGLTLTEFIKKQGEDSIRAATEKLPLPRAAEPEEMAKAYIYLMTNDYVTGQVLPVDGGQLLI